jgi:hypothetical protein
LFCGTQTTAAASPANKQKRVMGEKRRERCTGKAHAEHREAKHAENETHARALYLSLSLSVCQHIDFVVLFGPAFEVHAGPTAAHGCSSQVARLHRRRARLAVTAAVAAPAVARVALAAPKVR